VFVCECACLRACVFACVRVLCVCFMCVLVVAELSAYMTLATDSRCVSESVSECVCVVCVFVCFVCISDEL
jgi:hypothetical protein